MEHERRQQLHDESPRERDNRMLSRQVAQEGMVLLKNNGVLPLRPGCEIALFGSGALYTLKGGTGSGDVNERHSVSIYEGMVEEGFSILNTQWLEELKAQVEDERQARNARLMELRGKLPTRQWIWEVLTGRPAMPVGRALTAGERAQMEGKTAVYVLSRQAGEGGDRRAIPGDYCLSECERMQIKALRSVFGRLILLLNCGGPVDLDILDEIDVDAVLFIAQPGMEGGRAAARILSGAVTPSGKLTDTWAVRYTDYPSSKTFNARSDAVELYPDGIYVGYRYFDTFGVEPRFPFGFGLSYTRFQITYQGTALAIGENGPAVTVEVDVRNIGTRFGGREVVQLYVHCPEGTLDKEYKRLAAFSKTPELRPGEQCRVAMTFLAEDMASFSEERHAYIMEPGDYVLLMGTSCANAAPVARLRLPREVAFGKLAPICPMKTVLETLKNHGMQTKAPDVPVVELDADTFRVRQYRYELPEPDEELGAFVDTLSVRQMTLLVNGDPNRAQGVSDTIGSSGRGVPGSAGETSSCAMEPPWELMPIVTADGPAGVRLCREYYLQPDGSRESPSLLDQIEKEIFGRQRIPRAGETTLRQYCTAFPVGVLLAQTWDPELLERIGMAVSRELREYGVHLWLAPGMNIHRDPLQGRNFEYFSEDPYLPGIMAAAIVRGVQKDPRTGATIKHFVCNHRENDRKRSDSVVQERTLREIYLKGFEVAVKRSAPVAVMSSYNLVNGVHTANSHDLLTKVLRCEWGFQGIVMTDWTTTGEGGSLPEECVRAGNDLIMPGTDADAERIRQRLAAGALELGDLRRCAARMVKTIWALDTREKEGEQSV